MERSSRSRRSDAAVKTETNATTSIWTDSNENKNNVQTENKGSGGGMDVDEDNRPVSESVERDESVEAGGSGRKKRRALKGVDTSLIISEDRSKRRRTPTPEPVEDSKEDLLDPKDKERAKKLGTEIYDKIMAATDKEGNSMSEPFITLPSKRSLPDYYETIKHPMSLEIVHSNLKSMKYETLKEVTADLGQIFWNAKRYNVKESLIFLYAKKLHKMTKDFYENITTPAAAESESEQEEQKPSATANAPQASTQVAPSRSQSGRADTSMEVDEDGDGNEDYGVAQGGPSTASVDGDSMMGERVGGSSGRLGKKRGTYMKDGPTVYKLVKPVLKAIKEAKARDGTGRDISGIFMDLPDRNELPDYYEAIEYPISLTEIESKMVSRVYTQYDQFFNDINLMCNNAFIYNEDDSEVFRDAQQIKDMAENARISIRDRLIREEANKRMTPTAITPVRFGGMPGAPGSMPGQMPYQQSPTPNAYPYSNTPPQHPTQGPPASFLPALPRGVVTEDIVNSLNRYPPHEQQAWLRSLPPLAMNMYRQMMQASEARRRASTTPSNVPGPSQAHQPQQNLPQQQPTPQPQPLMQLADMPSASRPGGIPSSLPNRQAPPYPTIKCLDFAFTIPGTTPVQREAIRLHNMRGVITHAVLVGSDTSELELTAYVADNPSAHRSIVANGTSTTNTSINGSDNVSPTKQGGGPGPGPGPEVSLRINGMSSMAPKFVYDPSSKPTNGTAGNDSAETATNDTGPESENKRPAGMRWTITVPTQRTESKLEVVATKPGGATETTVIYLNRQM